MIGGGNGDNDVTHIVGEDKQCDSQLGPISTAHLSSRQEGTALNLCPCQLGAGFSCPPQRSSLLLSPVLTLP
jgi:hypothetical protein